MDSFCELDFSPINFADGFHCVVGLRRLKVRRDVLFR